MEIEVPCKENYTKSSPSTFALTNTFRLEQWFAWKIYVYGGTISLEENRWLSNPKIQAALIYKQGQTLTIQFPKGRQAFNLHYN